VNAASEIYEKLGTFYLGKEYDLGKRSRSTDLLLYDSKDLVTHAVIVGMTGSGKTGLGVGLLEEAAIDGIPALIVDPKGDMGNLMLRFPKLRPEDFAPWVHADDAARRGISVEDSAAREADKWRKGLADWDQSPDRIQNLETVDYTLFTPGSDAGVSLSILSTFAAPPAEVREDGDLLRDRVSSTVTSLLMLLGINAQPLRSREHILLTNLLTHVWNEGQNVDLSMLIRHVQSPPFSRVGVMDLEAFFPARDRFDLSMSLNNLLAAPSFASWMKGEPLDVDRLLFTSSGKPRHSIFSIAHLSDSERMFFVSLLLNETLAWMRSRPGTTSLRCLLYIDELFGYLPPVAEPPSKKPLLTLLKQARAFGLGIVLATQNPVDLDYKGLSNTGTWFLGRLQTERDKQRVLEGLQGVSAEAGGTFDRRAVADILSQLDQRVFLMHNIHEDRPAIFQTRWALSYLAGPMTRNQIRKLLADKSPTTEAEAGTTADTKAQDTTKMITTNTSATNTKSKSSTSTGSALPAAHALGLAADQRRPVLPPEIREVFLPVRTPLGAGQLVYEPALLGSADMHFVDTRKGLAADQAIMLLAGIEPMSQQADWMEARVLELSPDRLETEPQADGQFAAIPSSLAQAKNLKTWQQSLAAHLYRTQRYELLKSANLGEFSRPGESERDFRIRIAERSREERDRQVEKLREKYASKMRAAEERVRRSEEAVDREAQQASSAKLDSAISFGATILGAVLGRKKLSSTNVGRAATTARGMSRASKQVDDVRRAETRLLDHQQELEDLERQIEDETRHLGDRFDPLLEKLESIELKPRRRDINVRLLALAWVPGELDDQPRIQPLA
jgi:hypothetical protein